MRYFLPLLLVAAVAICLWQWRRSHRAAAAPLDRSQKIISAMNDFYSRPQIQEAAARARAELPKLLELFAQKPEHTSVLVRYRPLCGPSEVVWADLRSIDDARVTCHIRTRLTSFPERLSIDYSCPISELLDWLVRVGEREVRGGFTLSGIRVLLSDLYGEQRVEEFDRDLNKYVNWTDIA
jgi:hypothetical protein